MVTVDHYNRCSTPGQHVSLALDHLSMRLHSANCHASIAAIEYYLPSRQVSNQQLAAEFPEWDAAKIAAKTGIEFRYIAGPRELSSDLAVGAAQKLFSTGRVEPREIDFVLFCTQTPDFGLPTSACLLQHRLGIESTAGALDFNLGCSGYVYGLSLAKGLIESGQAKRLLLLTGETYSKLIDPKDKAARTIFGDAGSATLVTAEQGVSGPSTFVFGTDGAGGANLVCHRGGWRGATKEAAGRNAFWMNGPEIFNFTLRVVPDAVQRVLVSAGCTLDDIDLFIFHQANRYMLDHLRKKLRLPEEKFVFALAHCGNTVSNSIPVALYTAIKSGRLVNGMRVMVVGFGVGYSWAAGILTWNSRE